MNYNFRESTLAARAASKEPLPEAPRSVEQSVGREAVEARVADRGVVDPEAPVSRPVVNEEKEAGFRGAAGAGWEVWGEGLRLLAG